MRAESTYDVTSSALSAHPSVVAAERLARDLLAPQAAAVDATCVPRSHLDAIGRAGLLALAGPDGPGEPVVRRVQEVLAGADCATWFVSVQHHMPVGLLTGSRSPRRPELLPRLLSGELLAGVAFSHLRAWPRRPVAATRVDGGWKFDGVAPWFTGWGLSDVMVLAAATEDGEVLHAVVPATEAPGLSAGEPMRMAAMTATRTVRLTLDGLEVADDDVLAREPVEAWLRRDRCRTANVVPGVLGVTETAVRLLREAGEQRESPAAVRAADRLAERLAGQRERCYRLIDENEPAERLDERLAARAAAQRLVVEATQALVTSGGGRAMAADQPAQRLAREAMFLLVQAQTAPAREALLDLWG